MFGNLQGRRTEGGSEEGDPHTPARLLILPPPVTPLHISSTDDTKTGQTQSHASRIHQAPRDLPLPSSFHRSPSRAGCTSLPPTPPHSLAQRRADDSWKSHYTLFRGFEPKGSDSRKRETCRERRGRRRGKREWMGGAPEKGTETKVVVEARLQGCLLLCQPAWLAPSRRCGSPGALNNPLTSR